MVCLNGLWISQWLMENHCENSELTSNINLPFAKQQFTGHLASSVKWRINVLFYWYWASCVLFSRGQGWQRPLRLINLLDWNSQNIHETCSYLQQCDSFNEKAFHEPDGVIEGITYFFTYKDMQLLRFSIALQHRSEHIA